MARLTMAQRRRVPKSQLGVPSKGAKSGSFPIPDRGHAIAALRLIGNAPTSARARIRRLARQKLGRGPKKKATRRPAAARAKGGAAPR